MCLAERPFQRGDTHLQRCQMKIHLPVLPPPITPPPPPKPAEQLVFMIEQAAHEEFERIKTQRQAQKMMRAVTRAGSDPGSRMENPWLIFLRRFSTAR